MSETLVTVSSNPCGKMRVGASCTGPVDVADLADEAEVLVVDGDGDFFALLGGGARLGGLRSGPLLGDGDGRRGQRADEESTEKFMSHEGAPGSETETAAGRACSNARMLGQRMGIGALG